jgi:DNA-binding response OmpR family regulator
MKILIIEDEEKIARSLRKGFIEEYYDVDMAFDGEKGLEMIVEGGYDAVILDLMLPKINGLQVLRRTRTKKISTPIIILTAKDSVDEKVEGLNIGADDYLAKPFSFEELLARVKALIRRAHSHENILTADTLTLDPETLKVMRNGVSIDLSKREYKILEYLMSHKGAVLSENQIISHVWDYDADVSSNVIAAHIKNLRAKIDKAFSDQKPILKTVRGLGYKIDE